MKDQSLELMLQSLSASSGATLWIVDENIPQEIVSAAINRPDLTGLTNRYDTYKLLSKYSINSILSDFDFSTLGEFQHIVYRISKEKYLTHHCINQAFQHLTHDGELTLIGNKQEGIKSIAKHVAEVFTQENTTKKNGNAYIANFTKPNTEPTNQLPTNDYATLRAINHPAMTFFSKPGVFGWEKVDKGSELLVTTLPKIHKHMKSIKSVLDLGCGWGYLMLATKDWDVAYRCATDNNVAAIDAASHNFSAAGLTVDCRVDDCASEITDKFDLILCNPPFHQGFAVSDSITDKFLKNASRLCRRSTRVIFVVNQFIPIEKLAAAYFSQCQLLAADNGFHVLELRH